MKNFLIGTAALMAFAAPALGADLPARPYAKAPVYTAPQVVYNWTGFYIGGNVGYSWGRSSDTATLTNGVGTLLFTDIAAHNMDGIVGGGQAGYNWQIPNSKFESRRGRDHRARLPDPARQRFVDARLDQQLFTLHSLIDHLAIPVNLGERASI